jgi:hypothetical protein
MNGRMNGLTPDELRAAVRAVLREVLPAEVVADGAVLAGQGEVTIATEADLTAFVRRVAALCEDPQVRSDLQGGRHSFRLVQGPRRLGPVGVTRIERGAVTERAVAKAAADGGRLVLGRGAVLTPLARDKARSLGVEIEKER